MASGIFRNSIVLEVYLLIFPNFKIIPCKNGFLDLYSTKLYFLKTLPKESSIFFVICFFLVIITINERDLKYFLDLNAFKLIKMLCEM